MALGDSIWVRLNQSLACPARCFPLYYAYLRNRLMPYYRKILLDDGALLNQVLT